MVECQRRLDLIHASKLHRWGNGRSTATSHHATPQLLGFYVLYIDIWGASCTWICPWSRHSYHLNRPYCQQGDSLPQAAQLTLRSHCVQLDAHLFDTCRLESISSSSQLAYIADATTLISCWATATIHFCSQSATSLEKSENSWKGGKTQKLSARQNVALLRGPADDDLRVNRSRHQGWKQRGIKSYMGAAGFEYVLVAWFRGMRAWFGGKGVIGAREAAATHIYQPRCQGIFLRWAQNLERQLPRGPRHSQ
jgi:hypothetical protein